MLLLFPIWVLLPARSGALGFLKEAYGDVETWPWSGQRAVMGEGRACVGSVKGVA